jgi:phosphatidylserine/phosphatidylglycerophosphate/cardiolipin synthase-like enzyme
VKKSSIILIIVSLIIGAGIGRYAGSNSSVKPTSDNVQIASMATTTNSEPLKYYFTQAGDHPEKALVTELGKAQATLDIAIYSLTHPDIVQAIIEAKKRGVNVRIITDQTEAKNKTQGAALQSIKSAGILIKQNTHSGLMHLKVSIIDNKEFTSGSFNYSNAASTTNDEVLIIDQDPKLALKWDQEFESMWNDTKKFTDY